GKYTKYSFQDRDSRVEAILERFHSHVCGPFSTSSMTKNLYYVIFVDDYSCKYWIFFMKTKNQTFTKFSEFKALVEKESGKKVKALWSDYGGEYVSKEFNSFCALEGVK
ncbi:DDE-type integrase/transposase/recombinase, partial [Actinobacillus pleuropneumoniae]|uniref:DDE-type integrase/transposase/recombinase n=1 Tax=Actinobacillus pleuropneumoniae TaxID=715 RepID=UPI00227C9EFC